MKKSDEQRNTSSRQPDDKFEDKQSIKNLARNFKKEYLEQALENTHVTDVPSIVGIILIVFGAVVVIPYLVSLFNIGTDNHDWLGFWGSYLGAIIGVTGTVSIAYLNTRYQVKNQKKSDKQNAHRKMSLNRYENFKSNIAKMHSQISSDFLIWKPSQNPVTIQSEEIETIQRNTRKLKFHFSIFNQHAVEADLLFEHKNNKWLDSLRLAEEYFAENITNFDALKFTEASKQLLSRIKKMDDYVEHHKGVPPYKMKPSYKKLFNEYQKTYHDLRVHIENYDKMIVSVVDLINDKQAEL